MIRAVTVITHNKAALELYDVCIRATPVLLLSLRQATVLRASGALSRLRIRCASVLRRGHFCACEGFSVGLGHPGKVSRLVKSKRNVLYFSEL